MGEITIAHYKIFRKEHTLVHSMVVRMKFNKEMKDTNNSRF